jgi:hypothetical protein
MVMKHSRGKEPAAEWLKKAREKYAGAMDEMPRGNTQTRGGARSVLLYLATPGRWHG